MRRSKLRQGRSTCHHAQPIPPVLKLIHSSIELSNGPHLWVPYRLIWRAARKTASPELPRTGGSTGNPPTRLAGA